MASRAKSRVDEHLSDPPMVQERAKIRHKSRYGFLWFTLAFFLISLAGHWITGWFEFVNAQQAHQQPIEVNPFIIKTTREMLENWQSEFLQLVWQVAGLTWLLFLGSPQSREGDDRKEEKLDLIIKKIYSDKEAMKIFEELDSAYPRK